MIWLIWIGAGMTVLGLFGVVFSIFKIAGARRANLSDAEMRERLSDILPYNLGGLGIAVLGLMTLVLGLFLG